jgi:hypothetical protein
MTRKIPGILAFEIIVLLAAGCGPEPVRARPLVAPPMDAAAPDAGQPEAAPPSDTAPPPAPPDAGPEAIKDAGAAKDAGVEVPGDAGGDAVADGRESRPKLPAPDGGADAVEAGGGADAVEAGGGADAVEAGGGADAVDAEPVDAGGATPAPRRPAAGEVRIAEVHVNPAGQDSGREWIEIASRAAEPLDLAALHLADAAGDVAVPAGTIYPGARLALGQSANFETNGGATLAAAYGTRLALNNDGDEISLCIGPCADGVVIDRVTWGALGAAYDGHALIVDLDTNRTCPATEPYGIADFGTPGAPDSGCAAPDGGI